MRAICSRALEIDETVSDAVDCDEQGADDEGFGRSDCLGGSVKAMELAS